MKIKIDYGYIRDVYAIYWVESKVIFLATGNDEYCGLNAYNRNRVEVVDAELSGNFVYHHSDNATGIFHWALIKERLLDDVLEKLPEACVRFFSVLKEEGRY